MARRHWSVEIGHARLAFTRALPVHGKACFTCQFPSARGVQPRQRISVLASPDC